MATTAKRLIPRNVIGTAKKAFVRMNVKSIEALKEAASNAMTWMNVANIPAENRIIKNTKNIGNSHDLHLEAIGTGINNYEEFVNIGHLPNTEEYRERLSDPEFLGQIGIGINSLLDVSEIGTVEFHNVSIDEKGRTKGFIAVMHDDPDMGPSFEDPPETPDSKYILDYVGLKVVVKNAKEYSTSAIVTFISETFARKLVKSSNQDYKIHVKDTQRDLIYTTVHKPQGFCSSHEEMIGEVSKKIGEQMYKFPVYVDLHEGNVAKNQISDIIQDTLGYVTT